MKAGAHPLGCLTDVEGLAVGHHHRVSTHWRTGTTVVVTPPSTTGGVSVRGAAPGTRETDLLGADALVRHVDAICLTGGSAFGLDAAGGVMTRLHEMGRGFPVGGPPDWVVPIVPAAVIFDLGRAGKWGNRPDASFGYRACRNARVSFGVGSVGAGTGARAGGLQGGVGTASKRTPEGHTVAALAVVNAIGSVIDPETGLPWHVGRWQVSHPSVRRRRDLDRLLTTRPSASPTLNTTIGVVATDAALDKAWCTKLADVAHDGLARAIRPAHSMNDGDCIFGLSTGRSEVPVVVSSLNSVLSAAAEVFAEACTGAVLGAVDLGGSPPYRQFLSSSRVH
ncbi:MAG: P1 family peptidase [Actinomycetota bacterium]|nr:P1 family peptidase [Actinomycetota bacterium]MDA2971308.1 P1 family peptidase [Actinomycetota bacterium]MDA3001735.1 P1 family peptidase [Actinomycetota bacterium]